MKELLAYLFCGSQAETEFDEACSVVESILEAADKQEPIVAERTPLVKALKALKLDVPDSALEYDPEGFALCLDNEADYRNAVALLMEPDAMEKLAKLGWVVTRCGDNAMSNEEPSFRVRFLEITTCDAEDSESWPAPNQELVKKLIKQGREFVNEPFERDDDNPVEDTAAPDEQQAGVGKAQAGKNPEGKPKTGKSKTESANLVAALLGEGGHKPGCTCGFCKNKGKGFGKKKKDADDDSAEAPKSDDAPAADKPAKSGDVEHTFESVDTDEPPRFDDIRERLAMRRGHPKAPVKDKPIAKSPKAVTPVKKAYRTPRK